MLHAKYLFEEELKKSGLKYVILRPTGSILEFSKWTLTEEMVGSVRFGTQSFRQYIKDNFNN